MTFRIPALRSVRWRSRLSAVIASATLWLVAYDALAAGGKPATKLVNVADTRGLDPGLTKWVADIYNTSHWLFALLVVVVMCGMGVSLGLVCDKVVGLLGINLGKMDHHE